MDDWWVYHQTINSLPMNTKRPLLRLPLIFASGLLLLHYPVTASAQYLYVANTNYIGLYDATTGAAINTNFISGLHYAQGMAVLGTNLFVANGDTLSIAEYNAFTGALISSNFITGLNSPLAMLVAAPEPSTYALFGLGGLALLIAARRRVA